jgi:hypothetical protein
MFQPDSQTRSSTSFWLTIAKGEVGHASKPRLGASCAVNCSQLHKAVISGSVVRLGPREPYEAADGFRECRLSAEWSDACRRGAAALGMAVTVGLARVMTK